MANIFPHLSYLVTFHLQTSVIVNKLINQPESVFFTYILGVLVDSRRRQFALTPGVDSCSLFHSKETILELKMERNDHKEYSTKENELISQVCSLSIFKRDTKIWLQNLTELKWSFLDLTRML